MGPGPVRRVPSLGVFLTEVLGLATNITIVGLINLKNMNLFTSLQIHTWIKYTSHTDTKRLSNIRNSQLISIITAPMLHQID